MKCYRCGLPYRLVMVKNQLLCQECEKDVAMFTLGLVKENG